MYCSIVYVVVSTVRKYRGSSETFKASENINGDTHSFMIYITSQTSILQSQHWKTRFVKPKTQGTARERCVCCVEWFIERLSDCLKWLIDQTLVGSLRPGPRCCTQKACHHDNRPHISIQTNKTTQHPCFSVRPFLHLRQGPSRESHLLTPSSVKPKQDTEKQTITTTL